MSGLSKVEIAAIGPGFADDRMREFEAENARLRMLLADREAQLDALHAALPIDPQIRLLADALPVLISYIDAGHRYRYNNKAYRDWFGSGHVHLIGRHMRDVLGEAAYEQIRPLVEEALSGRRVSTDISVAYSHGGPCSVHLEYVPDRQPSGAVPGFYVLVHDNSESHRAEEALRESEARFRAMADCAPAPVWVTNAQGIEFANRALCEFTGLSVGELQGDTWMRLAHPEDVAAIVESRDQAWQVQAPYGFEARFRRHDGEWRWLRAACEGREGTDAFLGYVGLAFDVTESRRAEEALRELNQSLEQRIAAAIAEREQAEAALRQAQKMEAVGQLTGGIAHDFNNLLTVISGNLDMAARRLGGTADPRIQRAVSSAMVGAQRAATLTQRLLAFSRRQPLAPKVVVANSLLAGMSELLHRALGETIEVETRFAAGLSRIEVDPHQLESAILNLAVNARDAMPSGGRLVIETADARLLDDEPWASDAIAPGLYVVISVSDSGIGMDEETRQHAVEPFFTTKDVGKGTGLGLSMVYGFVRQSGGHLRIDSEAGQGTSVHVYLPRLAAAVIEEVPAELLAAPRSGGEETVLVCEDDEDVRAYTVELLDELGYRVLEAHDGASTMRLLRDSGTRVDMLFTDVVLPGGMSGASLAQMAREARPELKILFTTGYARDAIVHEGRLDPGIDLVTKPFTCAELAGRVREVLDRS